MRRAFPTRTAQLGKVSAIITEAPLAHARGREFLRWPRFRSRCSRHGHNTIASIDAARLGDRFAQTTWSILRRRSIGRTHRRLRDCSSGQKPTGWPACCCRCGGRLDGPPSRPSRLRRCDRQGAHLGGEPCGRTPFDLSATFGLAEHQALMRRKGRDHMDRRRGVRLSAGAA